MPVTFEYYMIAIAILLILSVIASKLSDRFGIPALLFFLGIGMLAGSDGVGGIYFDDPTLAQQIGIIALSVILFSGGLDTNWKSIRPVVKEGILLSTLGVLITAIIIGSFARLLFGFTWIEGMLLGSIVSSTDAAAVFAILRSQNIGLKGNIKPLLELESGSNDPMAVFLTISFVHLILHPELPVTSLLLTFFQQMLIGCFLGFIFGKLLIYLMNNLKLGYDGLYPVLAFGMLVLIFGLTSILGGSGFLAVYIAGIAMGREDFLHKRRLLRFYDGLAWLMQITMFLTLGLLVFPSRLVPVILPGLVLAVVLILIARPLSIAISLSFQRSAFSEKVFISWVGLRGAVPIVLATYPKLAGLQQSDLIFNVVFFVVLTSVLIQGTTLSSFAQLLKVNTPATQKQRYPLEVVPNNEWKGVLREIIIPKESWVIGKPIFKIGFPPEYLIVLIARGGEFTIPNGSSVLKEGDTLLGLSTPQINLNVEQLIEKPPPSE